MLLIFLQKHTGALKHISERKKRFMAEMRKKEITTEEKELEQKLSEFLTDALAYAKTKGGPQY